jgi:hypothetical protein
VLKSNLFVSVSTLPKNRPQYTPSFAVNLRYLSLIELVEERKRLVTHVSDRFRFGMLHAGLSLPSRSETRMGVFGSMFMTVDYFSALKCSARYLQS